MQQYCSCRRAAKHLCPNHHHSSTHQLSLAMVGNGYHIALPISSPWQGWVSYGSTHQLSLAVVGIICTI